METSQNKFIDFIITQNCSFRCEYCSQSKRNQKNKLNATKETLKAFINFIKTIDRDFEITITGGEAILHPDFFQLIQEIKDLGFKINLITNLSFDLKIYEKIFNILKNSLNRYDISFHLDEIKDFNKTLEKLENFINKKPKETKTVFLIPIYNLNEDKEEKINSILKIANKYNIPHSFQHIRILNQYKKNNESENKYFKKEKIEKSYSKLCSTGKLSMVIYEDGECYRCYSSRFLKSNSLGNIKNKNFHMNYKKMPCVSTFCTCPKPKAYNQISDKKDTLYARYLSIKNFIFMPYYIFKRKNIIIEKLKQKFS